MFSRSTRSAGISLVFLLFGCDTGAPSEAASPASGGGGSIGDRGGAGGSGSGGARSGGAGGAGQAGTPSGGTGGAAAGGAGGGDQAPADAAAAGFDAGGASLADAAPSDGAPGASQDGPPAIPPATNQGPVAQGRIAYSQDFEQNMNGMSRSPRNLPEDRIQIIDDPIGQRGKIVRIHYQEGDNYRTSAGTQPRSWFSSAEGYTVKPGSRVSVAWGFMWQNVSFSAHVAQIIREGGPIWLFDVDTGGNLSAVFHRGSGGGRLTKLEPMKWYDFMVVMDYKAGGEVRFYVNGQMVTSGRSVGGDDARFDFGIYWRPGAHPTRTVYISNVSIGEL